MYNDDNAPDQNGQAFVPTDSVAISNATADEILSLLDDTTIDPQAALKAEADANTVASAKHRVTPDADLLQALAEANSKYAANGLKGFVAGKLEDAYALTPAERDEEIAIVKSEDDRLTDLYNARFDDESAHDLAFWFGEDTVFNEMIGNGLWDTMLNRYPVVLMFLLPQLVAVMVPHGILIEKPHTVGSEERDAPTSAVSLWCMANAESGVGKGEIAKVIRPVIDAINEIDKENRIALDRERQNITRMNREREKDNGANPLPTISHADGKAHPSINIASFTVPAMRGVMGSSEFWHNYADAGFNFIGRGSCATATEGKAIIAELDLNNPKSPNVQSLCAWWSGESGGAVVRKTDSETVNITSPALSMASTLTLRQMSDIINVEAAPNADISGFTARIVSVGSAKNPKGVTPAFQTVKPPKSKKAPKLNIQRDKLIRAFKLCNNQLLEQGSIDFAEDAYAAYGSYVAQVDLKALMSPEFNTKYWEAFVNKQAEQLIKIACGFCMMRTANEISGGQDPTVIEITLLDFERALALLTLSIADRRYHLSNTIHQTDSNALITESSRSLKQDEDKWFKTFNDPKILKALIAEKKATGKERRDVVPSAARKRLKERYNIDAMAEIAKIW